MQGKKVAIIGTGATAVQVIPEVAKVARELYIFQRTPSCIDIRNDWETDPEWAANLKPGWQAKRRKKSIEGTGFNAEKEAKKAQFSPEEKRRRQENANIDYVMWLHSRIDETVKDKATAASLKPWYMYTVQATDFSR